jgi:hypothetical protein
VTHSPRSVEALLHVHVHVNIFYNVREADVHLEITAQNALGGSRGGLSSCGSCRLLGLLTLALQLRKNKTRSNHSFGL